MKNLYFFFIFWLSVSWLFFTYPSFSFESLEDCLTGAKFYSKFFGSVLNCYFMGYYTHYKFFTNILWYYTIFFFSIFIILTRVWWIYLHFSFYFWQKILYLFPKDIKYFYFYQKILNFIYGAPTHIKKIKYINQKKNNILYVLANKNLFLL